MTALIIRTPAGEVLGLIQIVDHQLAQELANQGAYELIARGAGGRHLTIAEESIFVKFGDDLAADDVRGFRAEEGA
ncbi:MAG TPA: hypothetical protein VGE07_00560 [Herpetosiphonaceae bacterium]